MPIAESIGTLHQTMNGTVMKAPPTAANAEMPLIPAPTAESPSGPGSPRVGFGLRSNSRLSAAA